MHSKCLIVDEDIEFVKYHTPILENRGIGTDCVGSMSEGIGKLVSNDYLYVGINGDIVDFTPLLNVMRHTTNTAIFIATNDFTTPAEVEALRHGADSFSPYRKTANENVDACIANAMRKNQRSKMQHPTAKTLIFKDVVLSLPIHGVFVGQKKLDLSRLEFDLLHLLISNSGRMLPYSQILEHAWGEGYTDVDILWSAIKRLRAKLKKHSAVAENIENVRDLGYRLSLD